MITRRRMLAAAGGLAIMAAGPAMLLALCLSITSAAEATGNEAQRLITLKTMGSLFFGGTVTRAENGETFHGDHGYAQYYTIGTPSITFPRGAARPLPRAHGKHLIRGQLP